jgi:hypothetical protein
VCQVVPCRERFEHTPYEPMGMRERCFELFQVSNDICSSYHCQYTLQLHRHHQIKHQVAYRTCSHCKRSRCLAVHQPTFHSIRLVCVVPERCHSEYLARSLTLVPPRTPLRASSQIEIQIAGFISSDSVNLISDVAIRSLSVCVCLVLAYIPHAGLVVWDRLPEDELDVWFVEHHQQSFASF